MDINNDIEMKSMFRWVSTRQHALVAMGADSGDARRQAAEEYGMLQDPPASGKDVLSMAGSFMSRLSAEKRAQPGEYVAEMEDERLSMTETYRLWIEKHDHVAPDAELAFFTGLTGPLFYYARGKLAKEGYEFDGGRDGFNVISRPTEKIYTHEEVLAIVEKAILDVKSRKP